MVLDDVQTLPTGDGLHFHLNKRKRIPYSIKKYWVGVFVLMVYMYPWATIVSPSTGIVTNSIYCTVYPSMIIVSIFSCVGLLRLIPNKAPLCNLRITIHNQGTCSYFGLLPYWLLSDQAIELYIYIYVYIYIYIYTYNYVVSNYFMLRFWKSQKLYSAHCIVGWTCAFVHACVCVCVRVCMCMCVWVCVCSTSCYVYAVKCFEHV